MKKHLAALFIGLSGIFSAAYIVSPSQAVAASDADLAINAGIRVDDLRWNIAGNTSGTSPNILSELTWKDLDIFQVKARARTTVGNALYLRGTFGYGWIFEGDNQDSDYRGDNRSQEFSRSNNKADDGAVWDASGGVGVRKRINFSNDKTFDIIPLVGYSFHRQNLVIKDGFQTIPPTGAFPGLDSTYEARWQGPWAGVDLDFILRNFTFYGTFEYHLATYKAEADWNLRSDFAHPKSFEHRANGNGVVGTIGAAYEINKDLSLDANLDLQSWQTSHGVDKTFFSNGTVSDTQLNEAVWDSYAVMVGLRYNLR